MAKRVAVLSSDLVELNSCHPARARKLLKNGRAVVHSKNPFVIRLKDRVAGEETERTRFPDPGGTMR